MDDDNIFHLGTINGGKGKEEEAKFPSNHYVITDIEDVEWFAEGFLIFTPHHVAIMKTTELGAVPDIVIPIGRVKAAQMCDELEEEESDDIYD